MIVRLGLWCGVLVVVCEFFLDVFVFFDFWCCFLFFVLFFDVVFVVVIGLDIGWFGCVVGDIIFLELFFIGLDIGCFGFVVILGECFVVLLLVINLGVVVLSFGLFGSRLVVVKCLNMVLFLGCINGIESLFWLLLYRVM